MKEALLTTLGSLLLLNFYSVLFYYFLYEFPPKYVYSFILSFFVMFFSYILLLTMPDMQVCVCVYVFRYDYEPKEAAWSCGAGSDLGQGMRSIQG